MKAYEIQAREGLDALVRVERRAAPLGPYDVRVRVRAVSLNARDLGVVRGAPGRKAPIVPCSDGAGEVIAVGERVTRVALGDRVAAAFFPTWGGGEFLEAHHASALGGAQDGMLAEEVVLGEGAWVKVPDHLSFEQAATLPCAGVTAYNALFETGNLRPGDTVLAQGTGGVSLFVLQLAKAAGARVVLTSKSEAKRARATALGADHVLDYRANPAWGEAAKAWTGGRGIDLAVEVGGPGTFDQSAAALRVGGSMSLVGVITGVKGEISTMALIGKALRVGGIYVGSVAMFEALNRALSATRIEPVVDQVFSFGEARAAYERLASGEHFGKVVIQIA